MYIVIVCIMLTVLLEGFIKSMVIVLFVGAQIMVGHRSAYGLTILVGQFTVHFQWEANDSVLTIDH